MFTVCFIISINTVFAIKLNLEMYMKKKSVKVTKIDEFQNLICMPVMHMR